tara:strand:+ start:1456 stop:1668 length:213 start_codon:yes stop_codon:yes gene_type:complete
MTWEDIIKNKKSIRRFVDEVVENADRILDKYTESYTTIDYDEDLEMELRDVLRKIFISLASDYIEENPDM